MIVERRPGTPLAVLLALLGAWIVLRIALWQSPDAALAGDVIARLAASPAAADVAEMRGAERAMSADRVSRIEKENNGLAVAGKAPVDRATITGSVYGIVRAEAETLPAGLAVRPVTTSLPAGELARPDPGIAALPAPRGRPPLPSRTARFSSDAWMLLRAGNRDMGAPLVARYGASQVGAAARYRLKSGERSPSLHARTSTALDPASDRELALGFAARPVARLPVRAQAELRARSTGRSIDFAPAAFAVSELPPVELPLGLGAETYLAAGYVAGDAATPFVDGMVRVERLLVEAGPARLEIGAGAWGGAQEGAAALDIGPTASVHASLAGQHVTVSLDYRERIAGSAAPRSGFAVTVATGF